MGAIPGGWVSNITELVNQKKRTELLASLEQLATSVQTSPWLRHDRPILPLPLSCRCFASSSAGSGLAGKGAAGAITPNCSPCSSGATNRTQIDGWTLEEV